MAQRTAWTAHLFAGANSGDGFRDLFREIVDLDETRDFMILKGGPGVGKNTFLRQIGTAMEEAGTPVEYLHCSGDPDSLDGIVLPELRCAAADGTSPHVLEPQFPAAVDRYVDLGRFYDLTEAKADAQEVRDRTAAYKAAYARAYSALRAARQVERDAAAAVAFDGERAEKRTRGIVLRELRRKGPERGRTVRRFLGSLTWQGPVWRFDSVDALCPKVYEIADRFGFGGTMLERLRHAAASRGWDTVACMAPEDPDRIEHLLIPGLGLAFVTTRPGMERGGRGGPAPWRRIRLDALTAPRDRAKVRAGLRMASLLREDAVAALKEAKSEHDALEAVYNPYVDFDGVRALAALETGRLLSWLDR